MTDHDNPRVGPTFEMCGECGGQNTDGYDDIVHLASCSKAPKGKRAKMLPVEVSADDLPWLRKPAASPSPEERPAPATRSLSVEEMERAAEFDTRPRRLTLREMQRINADRSRRWMGTSPGWTVLEVAGELAGEVGELANVCKKLRRSQMGVPGNKVSDEVLLEQARGEVGDVLIVLMLTASKLGIDLQDAVCRAFDAKSVQMGFPERFR